jgi:hypothetical protein
MDKLTIPPIRTPLTDDPNEPQTTKQWWYYWQQLSQRIEEVAATPPAAAAGGGPYIRTLLLKDCTIGNDIADHVPIYVAGTAVRLIGVLRKTITSNLTVRVKLNGMALITLTIGPSVAVDYPVIGATFTPPGLPDLGILTWDVTASDGSSDLNGVASFTLQWSASAS